jgi:flagellar protein FliO/FliZ
MELFGGMPDAVKFIIVFLLILAVLVPLLWRRFNVGSLSSSGQRGRRLALIETAAVDGRRRLVLIKRDNVEHLLMIGGPNDIVVESNIARTQAAAREPRPIPDARSEATRQARAAEAPDWALPLEPMARPVRTVDLDAALPEPPARTAREAMADSMRAVRSGAAARRAPPAEFDNPPEEIAAPALTPSPSPAEAHHRPPQAPEVRPEPRLEPRRPAAAAPEAQRRQPAPEPTHPPPLPQSFPPSSGNMPEPKRERATQGAPRPVAPPAAVPSSPRPAQPVPATAAAGNAPPRPVQPVPAAVVSAAPVPPPRPTPSDESNLAEMAQRLEAALRRPTRPEPPPPPVRPQLRPEPPAGRKPVHSEAAGPAKVGVKSPDSPQPDLRVLPGTGKNEPSTDSLEDEMAKMLGRPGKP